MSVAVLFHRLGPYHYARLQAACQLGELVAVELSGVDEVYAWDKVDSTASFPRVTLFQDADVETMPAAAVVNALERILADIKPQVVAIPGWSGKGALAGLSWCVKTRTPAVVMSASTERDEERRGWKEVIKRHLVRLYMSAVVGGSPHVAYLVTLGLSRSRIFTGYDVVDNAYFAAGAAAARENACELRARLGLPERYFLAANRFVEKKNLPRLLQAYAAYRKRAGKGAWKLVLLGDGPLRTQLIKHIIELDVSEHVVLPGFKQYDELPIYYGLAGAFVHGSTTEQWGLVVNEAMASGLPVLVSERCGCAQDLVENGRNGYRFAPDDVDALARLMLDVAHDGADHEAMAQNSREIIARWTPETFAGGIWNAVDVALQSTSQPNSGLLDNGLLWALMRR